MSRLTGVALAAGVLMAPFACGHQCPVADSVTGPSAVAPAGVTVLELSYPSPGSANNQLDLYLPRGGTNGPATILYIHGGGWNSGDKSDTAELCGLLAAGGFPVATCNYTLSTLDAPGFPQAIYDVKAVVRWIRTDGADVYRMPTRIVVIGESAGGHLAQMLGTTAGVQRFEPLTPPPAGYRVDAVISFFAPGDLVYHAQHGADGLAAAWFLGGLLSDQTLPVYEEASPITYVSAANPPMALFHGMADVTVPFEVSLRTRQAVAAVCRYCRLSTYPDAAHGFDGFGGIEGVAKTIANLVPHVLADRLEPDLNGDGAVDSLDLALFVQVLLGPDAYNAAHPGCDPLQADLSADRRIDGDDIAAVIRRVLGEDKGSG